MGRTAKTPATPRSLTDPRRIAGLVAAALVLGLGWTFLGPAFLGGPMSMVIVSGNSMAPTMNDGDLAVVREGSGYDVGDVVAFRSDAEDGGGFVIHRIVGGSEADGFVMQGDNNGWLDPWEPTSTDIVGQLQWHLPGGGVWLSRVRGWLMTPLVMASLVGAAAVMFGPTVQRRRRRRARTQRRGEQTMPTPMVAHDRSRARRSTREHLAVRERWILAAGLVGALVVVAAAPLAWTAWRTPTTENAVVSGGSGQTEFELAYTAVAHAPSAVYPQGQVGPVTAPDPADEAAVAPPVPGPPAGEPAPVAVEPPQPLFTSMIPQIDVHVAYHLDTDAAAQQLEGTYEADLLVRSSEGWSTTVAAVAPTTFEGAEVEFDVPVVMEQAAAHLAAYAEATGTSADAYSVTVRPRVTMTGSLAGAPLEEESTFELPIEVGTEQIVPGGQLRTASDFDATRQVLRSTTLEALGAEITVSRARPVAVAGILLGLAIAASAAAVLARRFPRLRHRARHGSLLVDVTPQFHDGGRALRVTEMDELAKLARRDGRVILHQALPEGDRYFIPDGELTYEYFEPTDPVGAADGDRRIVHVQSMQELTSHWLDPRSDAGAAIVREDAPDGGVRCTLTTGGVTYVLELPSAGIDADETVAGPATHESSTNGHVVRARRDW